MSSAYGAVDDHIKDEHHNYREPGNYHSRPNTNGSNSHSFSSNAASEGQDHAQYTEMNQMLRHNRKMESEPGQRSKSNEFDIDIASEPRDIYKANHMAVGSAPSDNLKCLWFCIVLLFILMIASITCIDQYTFNTYGHSSISGFYHWSFGWHSAAFHPQDTHLLPHQAPLQFVSRYATDAGRFYIISVLHRRCGVRCCSMDRLSSIVDNTASIGSLDENEDLNGEVLCNVEENRTTYMGTSGNI